jgi:lipopolysaccharide transport system ATP-binding protein
MMGVLDDLGFEFSKAAIYGVLGELPALAGARRIGVHDALEFTADETVVLDHALALRGRVERGRAMAELERFRRAGGTAVVISYDEELLASIADEIWWMEGGRLRERGAPEEVLRAYRAHAARELRRAGDGMAAEVSPKMRRGDGRARIDGIELLGEGGQSTVVWRSGELATVRVTVKFRDAVADPVAGMLIRTRVGLNVYGTNTELERLGFGPCAAGEVVRIAFGFRCELCPGEYTLTIASHDPDGVWHEWLEDAVAFSVTDDRYTAGVANLRATVTVERT